MLIKQKAPGARTYGTEQSLFSQTGKSYTKSGLAPR